MVTPAQPIAARIVKLGLSQRKLAAMLRVSQPALNAWLNGYTPPPAAFAARATKILDLFEEAERAADAAREEVLARMPEPQPGSVGARLGGRPGGRRGNRDPWGPDAGSDELPDVLFLEDLATLLRCHPRTIRRRLNARTLPVSPIQGIDRRPRWSKAAVLQWLATGAGRRKPALRGRKR